jgi:hypothetical protein
MELNMAKAWNTKVITNALHRHNARCTLNNSKRWTFADNARVAFCSLAPPAVEIFSLGKQRVRIGHSDMRQHTIEAVLNELVPGLKGLGIMPTKRRSPHLPNHQMPKRNKCGPLAC